MPGINTESDVAEGWGNDGGAGDVAAVDGSVSVACVLSACASLDGANAATWAADVAFMITAGARGLDTSSAGAGQAADESVANHERESWAEACAWTNVAGADAAQWASAFAALTSTAC